MSYVDQNHTRKIEVPTEIAEGVNGEPAFVVMRTRAKNKHFRAFNDLGKITAQLNALILDLQKNPAGSEELLSEAERLQTEAERLTGAVYEAYVYLVADWNWLDFETGEPLAKPDSRGVIEDELTPQQIAWLREQVDELRRYRATEGNALTSTPS